ncbi:folate-binding protein 1 isoform X2 [Nicotiana tabacum]|uniref:Folate-binding protein 1 isoform X2 n=1 Tax=Nicotiana tabacum TaxID=4097 RepID=A0A1S4CHD3_TOBAC|nr:PREDICTED: uncharacterized protein LOC107819018 isoform X2 [Nicotiana tabacum]
MELKWRFSLMLLLTTSVYLQLPYVSGKDNGVCISPGGRFPRFSNEGKPPKKVKKGPRDLNLCRIFRGKTCCDVTQTHPALLSIRKLASTGEAGPPVLCTSFCNKVYQACSNAYFSMDAKTQVLAPCGVSDFVCGRASQWISNGTELCRVAGFSVKSLSDDPEEVSCYGGKSSVDFIADSWRASQSKVQEKTDSSGFIEDFKQWVEDMTFKERISWAVGGMVLTAGLLFTSQRKSHRQRQKLAALQRTARRLGGNVNPRSPTSQGSEKGS